MDVPGSTAPHLALGRLGEQLAAAHLRRDGMRILARNWRCDAGELDIIASDHGTVVFCEVKTRRSLRRGTPRQAVGPDKAERLRRLAGRWRRATRDRRRRYRFDLVCIVMADDRQADLDHRKGAL